MPRPFSRSTAEQVVQVVDAVEVTPGADVALIEAFCDLSTEQVKNALLLACDLGLLRKDAAKYKSCSVLARFFSRPNEKEKAAALRIALDEFAPFITFGERLVATGSADTAAQQTKVLLGLDAHREEIKDTLISLGTYTGAIVTEAGGRYLLSSSPLTDPLLSLAQACGDMASAEMRVRAQIGPEAHQINREEVLLPLARALLKAAQGDAAGAVSDAAIGVESFLVRLAAAKNVNVAGANGITQKLDKFRPNNDLPKKLVEAGRYLGQLRNAADHGVDVDPEVGAVWVIQESSGLQYVFVSCSFIAACLERGKGRFVL